MCIQHGVQHLNNFCGSWPSLLAGDCCENKVVLVCKASMNSVTRLSGHTACGDWYIPLVTEW